MKVRSIPLVLALCLAPACTAETSSDMSTPSGASCAPGQVQFDGRCAMQCAEGDNALCELDGTRVAFGNAGEASQVQVPACVGSCGERTPVAVAPGGNHTCVLLDDASVRCLGDDSFGQLGGSRITGPIPDLQALSISAGREHTCALLTTGNVRCWGRNNWGQLGDGTRVDRSEPVDVPGVAGVVQLAASTIMTFALLDTGRVVVWGSPMGYDKENAVVLEPMDVGLDQVTKIAATGNGACAIRTDGGVRCYGYHDGMHGGTDPDYSMRLDDVLITNAVEIACVEKHTCLVRLADGRVITWGFDRWGVTAQGIAQDYFRLPTLVLPLSNAGVVELAGGLNYACARFETGRLACWGKNAVLQLGYASEDPAGNYTPRELTDVSDVTSMALGTNSLHSCVRKTSGQFYCWGNDATGQLGGATKTSPLLIP